MELWEFNSYMQGYGDTHKDTAVAAILNGYYAGYYTNGGKKAKNPNELIRQLSHPAKQSRSEGLKAIERIKRLEQNSKEKEYGGYDNKCDGDPK